MEKLRTFYHAMCAATGALFRYKTHTQTQIKEVVAGQPPHSRCQWIFIGVKCEKLCASFVFIEIFRET